MTLDPSLDKDPDDFAHNYTNTRLKCPECLRTIKGSNHVKVFKNLAGLAWHIKTEHDWISNLQFTTDSIREVLRNIAIALQWGIIPSTDSVEHNATTSSLLFDERKLRKDEYDRLKNIAELLKTQSNLYPDFSSKNLSVIVGKVLGQVDKRTMKKYIERTISYSIKNIQNGTYDVSPFCNMFL